MSSYKSKFKSFTYNADPQFKDAIEREFRELENALSQAGATIVRTTVTGGTSVVSSDKTRYAFQTVSTAGDVTVSFTPSFNDSDFGVLCYMELDDGGFEIPQWKGKAFNTVSSFIIQPRGTGVVHCLVIHS